MAINNDLISRAAAIEAVEKREALMVGDKRVGVEHFKTFLRNRPAIDAEPVVRCKDCLYKNIPKCCPYQINGFKVTHDWYCPMGVKEVVT